MKVFLKGSVVKGPKFGATGVRRNTHPPLTSAILYRSINRLWSFFLNAYVLEDLRLRIHLDPG